MDERAMLVALKDAKNKLDAANDRQKQASANFERAKNRLIEALQDAGKNATAKYDGIGYAMIPESKRLFASYKVEDEPQVFEFLKGHGYDSLIKETVHKGSLSSVIGELLKEGVAVPECISTHVKQNLRIYGG